MQLLNQLSLVIPSQRIVGNRDDPPFSLQAGKQRACPAVRDDDLMRVVDGLDVVVQLELVGVGGCDGSAELGTVTLCRIGRGSSVTGSRLRG